MSIAALGARSRRSATSTFVTGNTTGGGGNGVVGYNWNPVSQLPNWIAAETAVAAGTPGARAIIVCLGDSTTGGVGANAGQSYPNYLSTYLTTYGKIPSTYANFFGDQEEGVGSPYFALTGSASWNFGLYGIGSAMISTSAANDSITWTPEAGRLSGNFNRVDVHYLDAGGTFSVTVSGGTAGSNTQTMAAGVNNGHMAKQTLSIPLGTYTTAVFTQVGSTANYLEGCSFWNSLVPAIEVYNGGVGGSQSSQVAPAFSPGANNVGGATVATGATLVMINFGINDVNFNNVPLTGAGSTIANLSAAVTNFRAVNIDPILIVPHPWVATTGEYTQAQLVSAMTTLATTLSVPVFDLNSTYGNAYSAFDSSTMESTNHPHPSNLGYQDFAQRYASALTNTPQTYANSSTYSATNPPVGTLV